MMNWKLKCAAFYLLRLLPKGTYGIAQKLFTGRYFDVLTERSIKVYGMHADVFRSIPEGAVAMEFGCGRNLLSSLLLSAAGAKAIYAFDISRLASVEHVNRVIEQLKEGGVPGNWRRLTNLEDDLLAAYRIKYVAPGDARSTGLASASVDLVCSTSVLEHIPPSEIEAILEECRRICSPRAKLSMIVDYHDHYATTDKNISRFNFYKYSSRDWVKFNPPEHFQNRLRHSDYVRMFSSFRTVRSEAIVPTHSEPELGEIALDAEFSRYTHLDLIALNGIFVSALT